MSQTPNNTSESQEDKRLNKRLKDMPVAIVGMASIFANSRYLNKFWDLISEKKLTQSLKCLIRTGVPKTTTMLTRARRISLTANVVASCRKWISILWSLVYRPIF